MTDFEKVARGWENQREFSYWISGADVEGEIPLELHGTFIRNGPGINEVYGKKLKHVIDGDGMICKLSIFNGKAHFQSKFVASKHRLEEQAAKKYIYQGEMGTRNKSLVKDTLSAMSALITGSAPNLKFRNPSNTNALYWGGKILSFYETQLPHCLDPYTLETLGLDDLNKALSLKNAGAHFRIDPETMNIILFSLRPGVGKLPSLELTEFNSEWKLIKNLKLHIEGLNYAHDFLLFPDYYLFHMTPFSDVSSWTAFKVIAGWTSPGESLRYYSNLPSRWVIIPRNAKSEDDVILVETEPCHIFHYGTAEQKGKELNFNCICLDKSFNMQFAHKIWLSNGDVSPGHAFQVKVDLNSRTSTRTQIDRCRAEFPTTHPYRNGRTGTRYLYLMASDRKEGLPYRDIVKLDSKTMNRDVWYSDGVIGEPVFVPRLGYDSIDDGDEDDGYVLVQLYHPEQHKTDFCILDAKSVGNGPIARIKLKHHVPFGFHGTFTPGIYLYDQKPVFSKSKL